VFSPTNQAESPISGWDGSEKFWTIGNFSGLQTRPKHPTVSAPKRLPVCCIFDMPPTGSHIFLNFFKVFLMKKDAIHKAG